MPLMILHFSGDTLGCVCSLCGCYVHRLLFPFVSIGIAVWCKKNFHMDQWISIIIAQKMHLWRLPVISSWPLMLVLGLCLFCWLSVLHLIKLITTFYYRGLNLSYRFQFVHVNEESSWHTRVSHRVSQGSELGQILFTLYMFSVGSIDKYMTACHKFPLLRSW